MTMQRRDALFALTASALPILGLKQPTQAVPLVRIATQEDLLEIQRLDILRTADRQPVHDVIETLITQVIHLSNDTR